MRVALDRLIAGATGLALACALHAQAAPSAPPPPTMVLDYHDVLVETILHDMSKTYGWIAVPPEEPGQRATVVSNGPAAAAEAIALVQEAMWSGGLRIVQEPAESFMILRVVKRPTTIAPGEMRVWRPEAIVAAVREPQTPKVDLSALPGSMTFNFPDASLDAVMTEMGKQFGFSFTGSDFTSRQATIIAQEPLSAGEAVALVDEYLAESGHGLQAEIANGKMALSVGDVKFKPPVSQKVNFKFENAPLETAMGELAKISGYSISSSVKGVSISMDEILQTQAIGTDVGPLVARLNEKLLPVGCVIEETSRAGRDGNRQPVLSVMTIGEARTTLLPAPVIKFDGPTLDGKGWAGVDMNATMAFKYQGTRISTILADMSRRFGFVVLGESYGGHITVTVPDPMNAIETMKLMKSLLAPLGYAFVITPDHPGKRTIVRVVATAQANRYWRTGSFVSPPD